MSCLLKEGRFDNGFFQGWGAGSIWTRLTPAPALAKKGPALTGSGSYYYIRKYILRNAITRDIYRYITSFFNNYIGTYLGTI